jgi:acetyl-CoA/propionyl-CoA carboxylase biotin carboxyl carrier protein
VVVEVGGRRIEVSLPAELAVPPAKATPVRTRARRAAVTAPVVSGDTLTSPMQGTVVRVAVADGQQVAVGELVAVVEAMKMEQPLNAHKAGTIVGLAVEVGQTVTSGAALCEIKG